MTYKCSCLCTPYIRATLAYRVNSQDHFYKRSVYTLGIPLECTGLLHSLINQYTTCTDHSAGNTHHYTCCSQLSSILNTLNRFCYTQCNYHRWCKAQYCTIYSWTDRRRPDNLRPAKSSSRCIRQTQASCKIQCCMIAASRETQRTGSLFRRSRLKVQAASCTQWTWI
jgi:hypothetical protein